MKLLFDENKLLTIKNPNIPETKEYHNTVSWYNFSSFDMWIIVLHKKQIKIINLKNLWEKMSVFFLDNREWLAIDQLDKNWFVNWFIIIK
jgi:hypothetical protein